jgi:thioredoxin-like negative regulator of GroEL
VELNPLKSGSTITELIVEVFAQQARRSEVPILVVLCVRECVASEEWLTALETWSRQAPSRINLIRVHANHSPRLALRCGLPPAPGFALFKRGAVVYQFAGEPSRRDLEDLFAQASLHRQPEIRPAQA